MRPKRIPVAKEGMPFIGFCALASVVFGLLQWQIPAVIALAITAFVLYFFRDPQRIVPTGQGLVISPADGRVIEVVDGDEGSLQGSGVRRISIFMNVFNVHVNRSPVSGKVLKIAYRGGSFWPADKRRALVQNEQNSILIETQDGWKITVVQVAGLIARRIVCWAEEGDVLTRGQRFGMIRFGSRLDVYVPNDFSIRVKKGEKVWAGQSILATVQ